MEVDGSPRRIERYAGVYRSRLSLELYGRLRHHLLLTASALTGRGQPQPLRTHQYDTGIQLGGTFTALSKLDTLRQGRFRWNRGLYYLGRASKVQ